MDKSENLMAEFSQLSYKFEPLMPKKQKGLIVGDIVYLNPEQTAAELPATIAEEIGHYLTSVGDITRQDTVEKRKQEQKARDVGAMMVVTPEDLISCYKERLATVWECAEFLGITEETMQNAIEVYSKVYEHGFDYKNYVIKFRPNGTLDVWED